MPPQSSTAYDGARHHVPEVTKQAVSQHYARIGWSKMLAYIAVAVGSLLGACSTLYGQAVLPPVLTQLGQAISGGIPVGKAVLTGTVTYHAGSITDTGPIVLAADITGQSSVQMTLNTLGNKTESVASGPLGACTWAGQDQVVHDGNGLSCWRPTAWFFPALSLQPLSILSGIAVIDLGSVTSSGSAYHQIEATLSSTSLNSATAALLTTESKSDIDLDPNTLLPVSMTYKVRPDSGAATLIPITVKYSNYQVISGVQVPMHIDRLVNGSNQLSIDLSTAAIN